MPDLFLDRLGDQLAAAQEVPGASIAARIRRMARKPRGRLLLAAVGALVVAAPAAALISPWDPQLSRPGIDASVKTSGSAVTSQATDVLAVLRRRQTETDRALATPLIRRVGSANFVDGVQIAAIRSLSVDWALVPAETVSMGKGADALHDQLCLTDGDTSTCQPAADVADNGVWVLAGSVFAGVVPDRVAQVRLIGPDGTSSTVDVHGNFFTVSLGAEGASPAPSGREDRPVLPLSGRLVWLDATGAAIGPRVQPLARP